MLLQRKLLCAKLAPGWDFCTLPLIFCYIFKLQNHLFLYPNHQNPLIFHENEPTLERRSSETTGRISKVDGALKSPGFGVSSRLHAEIPVFLISEYHPDFCLLCRGKSRPGGVSHPTSTHSTHSMDPRGQLGS